MADPTYRSRHERRLKRSLAPAIIALAFLFGMRLGAQHHRDIWYFGLNAGVDFSSGAPAALTDGALVSTEASSVVTHPVTGALLFYTDGVTVWNRDHVPMPDGTGLLGNGSVTQGALILPDPGDTNRYYVFKAGLTSSPTLPGSFENEGINYAIVDMRLDGGRGDVVTRDVRLLDSAIEGLAGVAVCGQDAYWAVGHGYGDDRYHAWKVTRDGIEPPVISAIGTRRRRTSAGFGFGWMRFSPDGRTLAHVDGPMSMLEIFDFDPATGRLANPITIDGGLSSVYGVAFSPSGRFLYVSTMASIHTGVDQFDLSVRDAASIRSSAVRLVDAAGTAMRVQGALQLGPDGRIYSGAGIHLDAIDRPDEKGLACGVRIRAVDLLGKFTYLGLPNFVDRLAEPFGVTASSAAICPGDTALLEARSGNTYRWEPAAGLSCIDCRRPLAAPDTTTRYTVRIETGLACPAVDTVVVTVGTPPTLTINGPRSICIGDHAQLRAAGAATYRWRPGASLSCETCSDPIVRPDSTTTYYVDAVGPDGCRTRDSVVVEVLPPPPVDLGDDRTICRGDSIALPAPEGAAWSWSPSEGLSCTDCREPIASPSSSTVYRCTVTNAAGCAASDSVGVEVLPRPALVVTRDTSICAGGRVRLNAGGGTAYAWTPTAGLSCADCSSPIASPEATTVYSVVATDALGCSATRSVTVTVIDDGSVDAGVDVLLCIGDSARLRASDGVAWRWEPASGLSCADCREPVVVAVRTISYRVTVTGAAGCVGSDDVTIVVPPPPAVDAGSGAALCIGESLELSTSGALTYAWSPPDGLSCIDCPAPTASPTVTTLYTVTGFDADGCAARDTVTVWVNEPLRARLELPAETGVPSGELLTLPIVLASDDGRPIESAAIARFELVVLYDPDMVLFDAIAPSDLTDGWSVRMLEANRGIYRAQLEAPVGASLSGAGAIALMRLRAYLGSSMRGHIAVAMTVDADRCATIVDGIGAILIDSLCGASGRLIALAASGIALGPAVPNPFNPSTTIRWTMPFDAGMRLSIVDARGVEVARPVDGTRAAGPHIAAFDGTMLPSGMYRCVLDVEGATRRTLVLLLVK